MQVKLDEGDEPSVMMAPLIDCVFLLLIFFLVTATLKRIHKELPINLPDAGAKVKGKALADTLVIAIDKGGDVYIEDVKVTTQILHRSLRQFALNPKYPNKRVRIDGDRQCAFQHIVRILDYCQFENLKNVGVRARD